MEKINSYINCIAHISSECNLLMGQTHTAVFDCGMAFCANETIKKIQDALEGRPLDYIFITHTHYDHVGALPFFRKQWPQVRLVTSEIGAAVLQKATPRRVIREFSEAAARKYGAVIDPSYNDDAFCAEIIVKEDDEIAMGAFTVKIIETPGHTKDSLSFFIPELEMLIACETPGVLLKAGNINPAYFSSYADTLSSIEKCRSIPYKRLSLPHRGLTAEKDAAGFFDRAMEANIACYKFISDLNERGKSEPEILDLYCQKYRTEDILSSMPKEAYETNAQAIITCALRKIRNNA